MNLVVVPFHDWRKILLEGSRTRDSHFIEEFRKRQDKDEDDMMKERAYLSTQNQAIRCHSEAVKAGICAMARKDPFCTK